MVAQKTLQIRKMVGMHTGSRKMTLMRVMFWSGALRARRRYGADRGRLARE